MSSFAWLFLGHLTGDFLFQTRWMAVHKLNNNVALIIHCLVYSLIIGLFSLPFGGLSFPALAVVFLSHAFLDKRNFIAWWTEHITGITASSTQFLWLKIVTDQIFHLLVLVIALHV